ncbi:MAG: LysE family transporter [Lachnospiraceae bacterium]|nr:LysE family transporter [Lachnospiraceae bacterium]
MPGYVMGNFFLYSVINAFTPGPGNILALNTVTNYGYKKGRPLFWGIFAGYYVVQILCAIFVFGVSTFLPDVLGIMKYIGAAYILWLAVHIAISRPDTDSVEKSASFLKGFLLQFVNVKIYLFGITALTGYITDFSASLWVLLLFAFIIATIGTTATLTWVGMGVLIQKAYQKHYRVINVVLALTLLECVYSMLH